MKIDEKVLSGRYLGRTFRFCSERCRKLFDLNPNKYFGQSPDAHQHIWEAQGLNRIVKLYQQGAVK